MKALQLLFAGVLATTTAFAQNAPVDFEPGGHGANWTWTVFENDSNPPVEIIANPDPSGVNTSSTVAKFTALIGGQPWAGFESQHGQDIGSFTLDASTSTITIKVWKSVISDVGIKLVEANSASLGEIKVANTVTNQWEELTFDFSIAEGIEYDQLVIFPDFDLAGRATDNICYIDDVTFGNLPPQPTPMEAAPDPTTEDSLVISMFSDEYTDINVDTWLTAWSVGNGDEELIDGNPTKRYTALSFAGVETVGDNSFDITDMDTFHLHMWTPNATQFRVKLVDFGDDNAFDGGDDTEHEVSFENPATESWIRYAIPLTDFTGLQGRMHMSQLIFAANPAGDATVYIDNVYFSKEAPVELPDTNENDTSTAIAKVQLSSVEVFPNPSLSSVQITSDEIIESITLLNASGAQVLNQTSNKRSASLNLNHLPEGIYFLQLKVGEEVLHRKIVKQ